MNKILNLLIVLILLFSCNKSTETVLKISHNEKGLSFKKVFIIQWNDTLKNNLVTLDSTVEMQFIGTRGFNVIDGKAFVGASMTVSDSIGTILFSLKDMFIDYDTIGFDTSLVSIRIGIFLETSHPMIKGGSYKWCSKIWDKKGKGEINAEVFIKIK